MSSVRTFTPFPRLPIELRNAIWQLSLPAPRIVKIRAEKGQTRHCAPHQIIDFSHAWVHKLPVPTILQICQESRAVGLQHYELAFDSNQRPTRTDLPDLENGLAIRPSKLKRPLVFPYETKAMIYVDLERDVFLTVNRWGRIMVSRRNRPKDPPEFAQWPVRHGDFLIDVFQAVVPRSILARMRVFVAKFSLSPKELFSVRPGERGVGIGMASTHRILVLNWPFDGDGETEDFVEKLRFLRKPGVQLGGRIRLLKDILELERVVRGGSLTRWAERKDLGEWSMGGYYKEE